MGIREPERSAPHASGTLRHVPRQALPQCAGAERALQEPHHLGVLITQEYFFDFCSRFVSAQCYRESRTKLHALHRAFIHDFLHFDSICLPRLVWRVFNYAQPTNLLFSQLALWSSNCLKLNPAHMSILDRSIFSFGFVAQVHSFLSGAPWCKALCKTHDVFCLFLMRFLFLSLSSLCFKEQNSRCGIQLVFLWEDTETHWFSQLWLWNPTVIFLLQSGRTV